MQLLDLKLNHNNLYSISTGEPISVEHQDLFDTNPSFKGLWHHEMMLDPILNDSDLENAWNQFLENFSNLHQDSPGYDEIEKFLVAYPEQNWVIYKNTTHEGENGPITCVLWTVVDLNTLKEEV